MKRKVVLALIATLTLTVGSLGTVFAMNDTQGITIQTSESSNHEHVWGAKEWVVDKEAWTETIEHPAETHEEQQWVVDQEAWDEQKIIGYHSVCNKCGNDYTNSLEHQQLYGCKSTSYTGNVPIYDTIHHPEEGHWETVTIVDKEAWTETIEHPEEGHWEHTCTDCGEVQNSETGEVITPGNPTDPEKPTDPEEPTDPEVPTDPEEPTNPEKPGTDDPTTEEPETPDNTQDADENKEQQDNDKTTTTDTTDKSENADTATTAVSNENKSPKTGDPSSLICLATLAGSAVTGGTAFGLRRKFK